METEQQINRLIIYGQVQFSPKALFLKRKSNILLMLTFVPSV